MGPRPSPALAAVLAAAMLAACTSEDGPRVETAEVTRDSVVETIAAPAELGPEGRVTLTAPAGGEVEQLLVEDGERVEAGDPVARLRSEPIEGQVEQARAAVEAADALAASAAGAGVDLSPVLGAFGGQLESVLEPVLATLSEQVGEVDDDRLRERLQDRLTGAREAYQQARGELASAEAELAGQAEAATAAQTRAADAQREQAVLALESARARVDDLELVAPADGVVELARADEGGGGAAGLGDLGGLGGPDGGAGGGEPGGGAGGGGSDLSGLLGAGGAGGGQGEPGPVSEGVEVGTGQPLLTVYDLSGFTARAEVDEIDVVEVTEGQDAVVLVDAYPDAELTGRVSHVAIAPERGATGGASFPVTVRLTEVPDDVELRVGLTASVEVTTERTDEELTVPTNALLRRGEEDIVFVVDEQGLAERTPVTVRALGETTAAVEGDLGAGDVGVTTGGETAEDGAEVESR